MPSEMEITADTPTRPESVDAAAAQDRPSASAGKRRRSVGGAKSSTSASASARAGFLCSANNCMHEGSRTHPRLQLPFCQNHSDLHEKLDRDGWPTDGDGDDDTCRWCCGMVNDLAPTSVETFLCDSCSSGWCADCLAGTLGAEYVTKISQAEVTGADSNLRAAAQRDVTRRDVSGDVSGNDPHPPPPHRLRCLMHSA